MNSLLQYLKGSLTQNDDLFMTEHSFKGVQVILFGLKSLIDLPKTNEVIEHQVTTLDGLNKTAYRLQTLGDKIKDRDEAVSAIFEGKLLIFFKEETNIVISVLPINKELKRSIEVPANQSVLQGGQYSFNEEKEVNIGLIRKEIQSDKLKLKNIKVGNENSKSVSILYYDGKVEQRITDTVWNMLIKNNKMELNHMQDVLKILGLSSWNVVSQIYTTELPQEASKSLLCGKIVLFIDRLPFALVIPNTLYDMFVLEHDRNFTYPLMLFLRILRISGFLLTLILPGLYVALVSVNPEVLRIELALSVAQSREGVPYPAFVEILIMLLTLELILEASVRLPKSVGPTITMVGGIILGQAVVEAKLVSNLLIIILAAVTIANSTIPGVHNNASIRLLKYVILICSANFGMLGILVGLFLVCAYLSSIDTFGVPYLNVLAKDDSSGG